VGAGNVGGSRPTFRARVVAVGRRGVRGALAALRSELARRLGQAAVAGTALGVAVVLLYATGDKATLASASAAVTSTASTGHAKRPADEQRAAVTRRPPEKGGQAAAGTASGGAEPGERAGKNGSAGSDGSGSAGRAPRPTQPAAVAAQWYAARNHLPPGKVRALQQDQIGPDEVRVLVLGDRGHGQLDTALVRVRRDASGSWRVP
jgi:hypothetical protein